MKKIWVKLLQKQHVEPKPGALVAAFKQNLRHLESRPQFSTSCTQYIDENVFCKISSPQVQPLCFQDNSRIAVTENHDTAVRKTVSNKWQLDTRKVHSK